VVLRLVSKTNISETTKSAFEVFTPALLNAHICPVIEVVAHREITSPVSLKL
jgi:hypothetical protein